MSRERFAYLYTRSASGNALSGISSRSAGINFNSSFVQIAAVWWNVPCASNSSPVAFTNSSRKPARQRSSSTENSRAEMIVEGVSWPSSS